MADTPPRANRREIVSAVAKEAALLVAVATALGVGHLVVRGIPLIADPADAGDAACALGEESQMVPRIDVVELQEKIAAGEAMTIVDARAPDDFIAAHIPGAISLPADAADEIVGVESLPIPPDGLVVTYCDATDCQLSEYLGLLLEARAQCTNVRVLEGGMSAWTDAGGETEAYGG